MLPKHFAVIAILVALLAFTVEKREAAAVCTSTSATATTSCACGTNGICLTGSSITIDAYYNGTATCKVNATAVYDCLTSARLVKSTDTTTPLAICGAGTANCTGPEWSAANKIIDAGACPQAGWKIEILYNASCMACAVDEKVRTFGISCN